MGQPRKLPPDDELIFLHKLGWGPRRVARHFGVSPGSVSQIWRRLGLSTPRPIPGVDGW